MHILRSTLKLQSSSLNSQAPKLAADQSDSSIENPYPLDHKPYLISTQITHLAHCFVAHCQSEARVSKIASFCLRSAFVLGWQLRACRLGCRLSKRELWRACRFKPAISCLCTRFADPSSSADLHRDSGKTMPVHPQTVYQQCATSRYGIHAVGYESHAVG